MALAPDQVAAKLEELRERHNLTKEKAAQRIGVSLRQYYRWEDGLVELRRGSLQKIADAYGYPDVHALITEVVGESKSLNDRLARIEDQLARLADDVAGLHEIWTEHLLPMLALLEAQHQEQLGQAGGPTGQRPGPSETRQSVA